MDQLSFADKSLARRLGTCNPPICPQKGSSFDCKGFKPEIIMVILVVAGLYETH